MSSTHGGVTQELPVRVRRTETGRGPDTTEMTVLCPVRDSSVSVAVCADCARREAGVSDGPGKASVRCRVPIEPQQSPEDDRAIPSLLERTPVSTLMTTDVTCVSPSLDIEDLADLFLSRRISGAPVVNSHGHPIGVVSKTDLVREHYEAELFSDASLLPGTVADVMCESALRLPESSSLAQATAIMAQEGLHRLPIVSDSGAVVGILSALDVVRWLAVRAGYMLPLQKR